MIAPLLAAIGTAPTPVQVVLDGGQGEHTIVPSTAETSTPIITTSMPRSRRVAVPATGHFFAGA